MTITDHDIPLDICIICGEPIPYALMDEHDRRLMHPGECERIYRSQRKAAEYREQLGDPINHEIGKKPVVLVDDPTGDFPRRARFGLLEVCYSHVKTIKSGISVRECWTPGTVFEYHARRYRVNDKLRLEVAK